MRVSTPADRSYKIEEVPARSDRSPLSRWALNVTPNGFASNPGATMAVAFTNLLPELRENRVKLAPKPIEVKIAWACSIDGKPVVVERGVVSGVPAFEMERPTKLWKQMKGGQLVDSLLLEGEAWTHAPDAEVWAALAVAVTAAKVSGRELRRVNDAVAMALLYRCGLEPRMDRLPNAPTQAKIVERVGA